MINLETPRMFGFGPYIVDGFKVNYLYGLNDLCQKYVKQNFNILELGVNDGVSTSLFSSYCERVVAVDMNTTFRLQKVLSEYKNIEFHQMFFKDFVLNCGEKFDFIYIDGMHNYNAVKEDIVLSLNVIKENGVLSGHDFNSENPGVSKAVYEFFDANDITVFSDSSWAVEINKIKKNKL